MRKTKHGLADLKQLRKKVDPPSPPQAQLPAKRPGDWLHGSRSAMTDSQALTAKFAAPASTFRNPKRKSTGPATDAPVAIATPLVAKPPTAMVNIQDQALFLQAVKNVQRIKNPHRVILPPVPLASVLMLRQRRETAVGVDPVKRHQVSDQYSPAVSERDDALFVRRGHGPDLAKNLKRGKWPIGATLDLHGDTLEQARDRLDRFLQSCLTHRIKCVRIVHGKGYGSKDGEPVLKQTIRRWLTQMEPVLAYVECAEPDGGSGAVQALLRTEPA